MSAWYIKVAPVSQQLDQHRSGELLKMVLFDSVVTEIEWKRDNRSKSLQRAESSENWMEKGFLIKKCSTAKPSKFFGRLVNVANFENVFDRRYCSFGLSLYCLASAIWEDKPPSVIYTWDKRKDAKGALYDLTLAVRDSGRLGWVKEMPKRSTMVILSLLSSPFTSRFAHGILDAKIHILDPHRCVDRHYCRADR
jgi:hypothetical protein